MNCITVGDTNTSTKPTREYVKALVASLIFLSSPKERMNLNPESTTETTAIITENDIAKFIVTEMNSIKSVYPELLRVLKSTNIVMLSGFYAPCPRIVDKTNLTKITAMKQITNPTIAYVKDLVAVETFPSSPAAVIYI